MPTKLKNKIKGQSTSYSYTREIVPFPEPTSEKIKPPITELVSTNSSSLFIKKELSQEEQAIEYMSTYKKFERVIVCNFYTGGGIYTRGVLDSIYRGFNPLNP